MTSRAPSSKSTEPPTPTLILGIETSCDETAAAVVRGQTILSNVVATQDELHAPFCGIVPEVASRAHVERVTEVIERALTRAGTGSITLPAALDAIAVTHRPGLIGSLLVGLSAGKALAVAWDKPFIGIDHIDAHVHSVLMSGAEPPVAVLVASGGHTSLFALDAPGQSRLLGATLDDAAGEAFDKVAAMLGLGFPGGPAIEQAAKLGGDHRAFAFPRPLIDRPGFDFSFSGIKTAVLYTLRKQGIHDNAPPPDLVADIAASFQEAVVDVLVAKTLHAAEQLRLPGVAIAGGVALNGRLRESLARRAAEAGLSLCVPDRSLCPDNAAMVAGLGAVLFERGERSDLQLDASARTAAGRASRKGGRGLRKVSS